MSTLERVTLHSSREPNGECVQRAADHLNTSPTARTRFLLTSPGTWAAEEEKGLGSGAQPAHGGGFFSSSLGSHTRAGVSHHGHTVTQRARSSASADRGAQRGLSARGNRDWSTCFFSQPSLLVAHDGQALSRAPEPTAEPAVCVAGGGKAGEWEEKDASSLWCCQQRVHLTMLSRPHLPPA